MAANSSLPVACCTYPLATSESDRHFVLRLKQEVFGEYYTNYCIWAYPESRKPHTEIFIQTPTPALVSYILGEDWRSRLDTYSQLYDHKQTSTEADEIGLAMRILKAGGAVLDVPDTNPELPHEALKLKWSGFEKRRERLFGWPDTGGVWVLHLTPPPDTAPQRTLLTQ